MDTQYFLLSLFLFFATTLMSSNLSTAVLDVCTLSEAVRKRGMITSVFTNPQTQHLRGHAGCMFHPLRSERAADCTGKDRSVCSSCMILATEFWRKMWPVNAVMWLCNATDCSGSGKVTYLLGWHDWPMSADVRRQASFQSAAARLCPWAELTPLQKTWLFFLPYFRIFLVSKEISHVLEQNIPNTLSEYGYADKW